MTMPETINVLRIQPEDQEWTRCFEEAARLLVHSFRDMGLPCSESVNVPVHSSLNIVIGGRLASEALYRGLSYVYWQLEQLVPETVAVTPWLPGVLHNAKAVWDFSFETPSLMKQWGVVSETLAPGYHPAMRTMRAVEPEYDVLYFGVLNERREKVLEALSRAGAKVKFLCGAYGSDRDAWIEKARIQLNIHTSPTNSFESVRNSHLVNNGCFIVTEESPSMPWPDVPLVSVPYDELVATCLHYLERPEEMESNRHECERVFAEEYAMVPQLKRALMRAMERLG